MNPQGALAPTEMVHVVPLKDERDRHRHGLGTSLLVLAVLASITFTVLGPGAPAAQADAPPAQTPSSGPAVAVVGGIDLAAWRGIDGAVWVGAGVDPAPGSARSIGGQIKGSPDLAPVGSGGAAVAARGTDDAAWVRVRAANGTWGAWRRIGGVLTQPPTIVSWGGNRLDVAGVGTDRALWHAWSNDGGASWSGWENLGGQLTSGVDASSWGPLRLDFVARGTDGGAWVRTYDWGWHGWVPYGGQLTSAPALTTPAPGSLRVVVRGTDGKTWTRTNVSGWVRRDGAVVDDPDGGSGLIAVLGSDGDFWASRGGGAWQRRAWAEPPHIQWPRGSLETVGLHYADRVVLSGWAIDDSAPNQALRVDVVVDGAITGSFTANLSRGDVGAHGFDVTAPAARTARQVCVVARDIGVGEDSTLGCRSLEAPPAGSFAFMATEARGHPVRWNPCAPVPIVFNPAWGPPNARAELDAAVAELRAATGLNIYVEGTTNEPASVSRSSVDLNRYGARYSPILVAFSDPLRISALAGGIVGLGGPTNVLGPDGRVAVSGLVIIDGPQALGLSLGWLTGVSMSKVFAHELGHVIGLGHTSDSSQLLAPIIPSRPGSFGSGDRAGLGYLGASQGCRRTPAPPGIGAATTEDGAPLPPPEEQQVLTLD